jgi:hypothetical protein
MANVGKGFLIYKSVTLKIEFISNFFSCVFAGGTQSGAFLNLPAGNFFLNYVNVSHENKFKKPVSFP